MRWRAQAVRGSVSKSVLADAALLLVTAIWGSTFVMVKDAVAAYPVFSFMALRFGFAALVLLPLLAARSRRPGLSAHPLGHEAPTTAAARWAAYPVWSATVIGLALFAGYAFQTAGLQLTTPAKAGFITGLSVVFVPMAAALALRRSPGRAAWAGVALATAGLALLSLQGDLTVAPGDLLVLGCAFAFASHILLTGRFSPRHDALRLTFGQVVTVAVLSAAAALLLDRPAGLAALPAGLRPGVIGAAAFTGVFATSIAFFAQTLAQRFTTSTHTALIFAAEPVFAGIFSFLLTGELLGPQQLIGCGLILAGMVVAEIRLSGDR